MHGKDVELFPRSRPQGCGNLTGECLKNQYKILVVDLHVGGVMLRFLFVPYTLILYEQVYTGVILVRVRNTTLKTARRG